MKYVFALLFLFVSAVATAQADSSFIKRVPHDTSHVKMNMDAVYNRPFLQAGKIPVSIGGYIEGNSSYFVTNGITEGLSFQFQRMSLFLSSTIKKHIKFLSEIELEEGGREIGIEFASMDVELHPLLNLRGGIILNPIGSFNQNHDGPKWEFVSRPVSSTTIIPATWSNAGFGIYGKYAKGNWVWAYEAYATNGFNDKIINNTQGRTWLPAGKENAERFEESFNGEPLITLKAAIKNRKAGELGVSWMGGVYNKFRDDGIKLDKKRRVDLLAVDANTTLPGIKTVITTEWVWAFVDVPVTYSQQFGNRQFGGFADIVQPVIKRKILGWDNSTINIAVRLEYADYNMGSFNETGDNLYDHLYAIVPAVSFRPSAQTVVRANYRFHWGKDLLGNSLPHTAGIQVGFSTYF